MQADSLKILAAVIATLSTFIALRGEAKDKVTGEITLVGWATGVLAVLSLIVTLSLISDEQQQAITARKESDKRHQEIVGQLEKQLVESSTQLKAQAEQAKRLGAVAQRLGREAIAAHRFTSLEIVVEFDRGTKLADDFQGSVALELTIDFRRRGANPVGFRMFPDLKGGSFGQLELFGGLKLPLHHDVAIQRTEADLLVHQRNAYDFAETVPRSLYAGPIFMGTLDGDLLALELKDRNLRGPALQPQWPFVGIRDFSGVELWITKRGVYAPRAKWVHLGFNGAFWMKVPSPPTATRVADTFGALAEHLRTEGR